MQARVVVVHDDPTFLNYVVSALQGADYDAFGYTETMAALDALETAEHVEVLITRITFPEGTPHGVSLALMARIKRPGLKVLFVVRPEMIHHAQRVGEILVMPVTAGAVVAKVGEMLGGVSP
jgi:DNA-binding NtrC family response regulator